MIEKQSFIIIFDAATPIRKGSKPKEGRERMNKTIKFAAAAMLTATAIIGLQAQDAPKKDDLNAKAQSRFERMDANQDGFVSFEEYANYWTNVAKEADTNKDGKIDAAETKARANKRVAERDVNKDGAVSQEELIGAKSNVKGDAKKSAKFADLDTNKDGKLSVSEVNAGAANWFAKMDKNNDGKAGAAEAEGAMAEAFAIMDIDKDGVVTIKEFVIFFAPEPVAKKDDAK